MPGFSRYNLPTRGDSSMQCYMFMETSPVSIEDDKTLRAQVHDALWMLTEQWRVGEFRGEDAGSPIVAKAETEHILINRFKGRNGATRTYEHSIPLEAKVERLPLIPNLFMRIQLGNFIKTRLQSLGFINISDFLTPLAWALPATGNTDYEKKADVRYSGILALASSQVPDGYKIFKHLMDSSSNRIYDNVSPSIAFTTNQKSQITSQVQTPFLEWVNRLYYLPDDALAYWSPEQLEYQFRLSAPLTTASNSSQVVLVADHYDNGDLDWYSFDEEDVTDINPTQIDSIDNTTIGGYTIHKHEFDSFVPAPLLFKGMPNERWWQFEDKNIDLAKIVHSKNDILGLSLVNFAQNYGNDWFVLPYPVRAGSLVKVKNLVVTDTFGKSYLVENATNNQDPSWKGWKMFSLSVRNKPETSDWMMVAPTFLSTVESEPFEVVNFFRDEQANMVWGLENTIPDLWNRGRSGKDAFLELQNYFVAYPPVVPSNANTSYQDTGTDLAYRLMNQVPEYWIPFIPIHKGHDSREISFQRGTFLRVINNEFTTQKVAPRTSLLSYKINPGTDNRYFIYEEDILRQGLTLKTSYQRCRWHDGSIYTWITRKASVGKGEGNSNVKYDLIVPKEIPPGLDLNTYVDTVYNDLNYVK